MKRRLALLTVIVAALLVVLAGWELWRPAPVRSTVRVVTVSWRCEGVACTPVVETERCTTCHEKPHPVGRHDALGCVACHGGDGTSATAGAAHDGLASLGHHEEPPAVEARCALCHEGTPQDGAFRAAVLARGRSTFSALRCGACHAATDPAPSTTPLETLGLRSSPGQLVTALEEHTVRAGYDVHLDGVAAANMAAYLRSLAPAEVATAMLHRGSVAGSSAVEGRVLASNLRCAVCHTDLTSDARLRTGDWLAYYLLDPRHANAAARMPRVRVTPREAASLAQAILPAAPPATTGSAEQGAALVKAALCASCHVATPAPAGPVLANWADGHDARTTLAKLESHAGYALSAEDRRALATYLLSQRSLRVRRDLRVPAPRGEQTFASSGCGGCHALADPSKPLSLFGEGLRVLPQWLFAYLRAPERHPVRPAYHPELAYRDLVPADRVTVRMPTYDFDDATLTDLVRYFTARDGATFPFASSSEPALTGDALTTAIGDVTRKDRGNCLSCHTIAFPDPLRAREEGDKLAPPLSLAHERLRPAWIEACIAEPEKWVAGMPAFARPRAEIEHVRDLLLLLRERTVLPSPGSEGVVPALGLGDAP